MWKKVGNSAFGKFIENERKRCNVQIATSAEQLRSITRNPAIKEIRRIDEDNVHFLMLKPKCKLKKNVPVGAMILDYAKLKFYKGWYDYLKPKFGKDIELLYGDTDSYYIHIKNVKNIFEAFKDDEQIDSRGIDSIPLQNAGLLGKLKFEYGDRVVTEAVFLRPKSYALRFTDGKEKKAAKGVKKSSLKNQITFEDYYNCLFDNKNKFVSIHKIQARRKHLFSEETRKLALSSMDTKRKILFDRIHTKAWQ